MSDDVKNETNALVAEVMGKVDAMRSELSDGQRAQVLAIAQEVAEAIVKDRPGRVYRPASGRQAEDALLDGTTYGRLGMSVSDVEFVHDLLSASRVADPRLAGPLEVTRNIVTTARKQRALDTAESGFGAQLVADASYVPELWNQARQEYGYLLGQIEQRTMTGPVEKQPVLGNVPLMIYASETTDAIQSATEFATQKVASQEISLTAGMLIGHYNYSGALVEDSIVPLVPMLRAAFAMSLAQTADDLILNGDTTNAGSGNINKDDGDPADTAHYLLADGIRHAWLVDMVSTNAVDASASLTYEKIVNLPTRMIDRSRNMHWGRPANPNRLAYICNPELEDDVLTLSELMTVQNFGAAAAVNTAGAPLNGEFVRIGRHPMISTIAQHMTAADGKVDTADGGTKGTISCVNFDGLKWGVRRVAQVEVERRAATDQWRLVLSTRVALGRYTPTGAASAIYWAAGLYNI